MRFLFVVLAFLVGAGCAPQVGDACLNSNGCALGQVCDTSSPGGYCIQYDCLGGSCGDGAICVDFDSISACMARCETRSDCRSDEGYVCRRDRGSVGFCYVAEQAEPSLESSDPPPSFDAGDPVDAGGADARGDADPELDGADEDTDVASDDDA